jgi:hypothetical protein
MKPGTYYMLDGHKIVETHDLLAWGRWFEKVDSRRVGWTARGRVQISTVFLGLDHNFENTGDPVLFETMIFRSWTWGDYQRRWHTWEEAEAGHQATVKMALGGWRGVVEVALSEVLYEWNLIPALPAQESWTDTFKWLFSIKR